MIINLLRRLLGRFRETWYARGHRPKPGTILFSPSLDMKHKAQWLMEAFLEGMNRGFAEPQTLDLLRGLYRGDNKFLKVETREHLHCWNYEVCHRNPFDFGKSCDCGESEPGLYCCGYDDGTECDVQVRE